MNISIPKYFCTPVLVIPQKSLYLYWNVQNRTLKIITIMKKILAIAVLVLGISIAAAAQPKALGLRFGYNTEISYQHNLNGADFVEANLGTFGFNSFDLSSTYNFMIAQPAWSARGEWGFYAGPGLALGFNRIVSIAVQGQIGLEYTFWFPLQLAVDLKPQFGFLAGNGGTAYFKGGLYGFIPSISVRYRF